MKAEKGRSRDRQKGGQARDADPPPPGHASWWERLDRWRWLPVALAAAALAMAALFFDANLDLSGDNAEFIILGRSLAAGQGLTYTQGPVPEPAVKFPFGFPLLLAATQLLFPNNLIAPKILVVLLFGLAMPLLYRLLRRVGSVPMAMAVCLCSLLSPPLLDYSHQVMSEIPYLVASLLGLLLLTRAVEAKGPGALAAALLAVMGAYYIRTAGVALVAAAVGVLLLRRSYREAGIAAGAVVLMALPWQLRNASIQGGNSYVRQLLSVNPYDPSLGPLTPAALLARVLTNAELYGGAIVPRLFIPTLSSSGAALATAWVLGIVLAGLLLAGVASDVRRRDPLAVYLALYLVVCLLWPQVWTDVRFLVPVIPLLFRAVFTGVLLAARRLAQWSSALPARRIASALLAVVVVANLAGDRALAEQLGQYPPNWRSFLLAAEWIRQNTDPSTVVASRKVYQMHLVSQRKSVGYRFGPPAEVIAGLEADGAGVVVVDQLGFLSTPRYLVPAIQAHRERFEILRTVPAPDTYILRFVPQAAPTP